MHYSHLDDVSHIMWLLYDADKAMQMQLNSFFSQREWKKYGYSLLMKTCKKLDDMWNIKALRVQLLNITAFAFKDDSGSGCSEDACRSGVEGLNITSPVPARPVPAQVIITMSTLSHLIFVIFSPQMYFLGSIFLHMKARKLWQNLPKFLHIQFVIFVTNMSSALFCNNAGSTYIVHVDVE